MDYYALRNKENDNDKSKGDGHGRHSNGPSSLIEIEEVNATCDKTDILFLDDVSTHVGVNMVFSPSHTWLLDSGVTFHVTLDIEWFSKYSTGADDTIKLGNGQKCKTSSLRKTTMVQSLRHAKRSDM